MGRLSGQVRTGVHQADSGEQFQVVERSFVRLVYMRCRIGECTCPGPPDVDRIRAMSLWVIAPFSWPGFSLLAGLVWARSSRL
jgi:hypothetical protein